MLPVLVFFAGVFSVFLFHTWVGLVISLVFVVVFAIVRAASSRRSSRS